MLMFSLSHTCAVFKSFLFFLVAASLVALSSFSGVGQQTRLSFPFCFSRRQGICTAQQAGDEADAAGLAKSSALHVFTTVSRKALPCHDCLGASRSDRQAGRVDFLISGEVERMSNHSTCSMGGLRLSGMRVVRLVGFLLFLHPG
ncbi:hypothetical protein BC567DRAFT_99650 [Phyllosticta citribraziliensis]